MAALTLAVTWAGSNFKEQTEAFAAQNTMISHNSKEVAVLTATILGRITAIEERIGRNERIIFRLDEKSNARD